MAIDTLSMDGGGSQFVKGPNEVDEKGQPTFLFDPVNNPLHKVLDSIGQETGKIIDITGGNRSKGSSLDKTRHFESNAVDIGFKSNPSFFNKKNGQPTAEGKSLLTQLLSNGFRLGDGGDHLHVDVFKRGDVDDIKGTGKEGQLFIEKGSGTKLFQEAKKILKRLEDGKNGQPESVSDMLRAIIKAKTDGEVVPQEEESPFQDPIGTSPGLSNSNDIPTSIEELRKMIDSGNV